jgi:two-component system response regulator HydG
VAATNADLKALVEKKSFRNDLYHRLNVVNILLPPLRDRRSDIPLLMDHFRRELSERYKKEVQGFSKAARQALMMYDWPGNIRQLKNTVERMLVLDLDGLLDVDDLPEEIAVLARRDGDGPVTSAALGSDSLIGRSLADVEKYYIQRALELTEGKREEAAQLLGIGERTLYRKIKEYDLKNG